MYLKFLTLIAVIVFAAMAAVPCPAAEPATQPGPAASPSVDDLLDSLDRRGKSLNDFDADVKVIDTDTGTMLDTRRTGHVWFQKLPDEQERLRVLLDKRLTAGDKQSIIEPIEYVLSGGWLTDRDYNKRIEVRRQVLRPGQKANLLKLGEGPFPLPIGQDKADVKRLFSASVVKPDPSDDPPGTFHLMLKPIKGTQFERKFKTIEIWVDPKVGMPARIDTEHGARSTSTILTSIHINPGLKDKDFALQPVKVQDWNVHDEPFTD